MIFVRPEARRNLQSDSIWIDDDLLFFSGVNLQVEQRRVNFCRITHISSLTKAKEQHNGVVRMVVIGITYFSLRAKCWLRGGVGFRDNDKINDNPLSLTISALFRPSDVCGKSQFI